jgi:hypothetical protein
MRKNFPERKKLRRKEAEARQAERAKLSDAQQLGWLDANGYRALKERARLTARIAKDKK